MANKKRRGRPKVDNPDDLHSSMARIPMKNSDLEEAQGVAKDEGYSFSAWVRMVIRKEIKRVRRRDDRK